MHAEMDFTVRTMTPEYAKEIANWTYSAPYDLYNLNGDPRAVDELLGQPYFAILGENEGLVGFYCYGVAARVPTDNPAVYPETECIDFGLGMRPNLTGAGLGLTFLRRIEDELGIHFPGKPLRLTVASFNARAVRLYKKSGFKPMASFYRGDQEFMVMVKDSRG